MPAAVDKSAQKVHTSHRETSVERFATMPTQTCSPDQNQKPSAFTNDFGKCATSIRDLMNLKSYTLNSGVLGWGISSQSLGRTPKGLCNTLRYGLGFQTGALRDTQQTDIPHQGTNKCKNMQVLDCSATTDHVELC